MKKNSNMLFSQISQEQLKQLMFIVNETIAIKEDSKKRVFTSADLWNIQRRAKQPLQRRVAL